MELNHNFINNYLQQKVGKEIESDQNDLTTNQENEEVTPKQISDKMEQIKSKMKEAI